MDWVTTTPQPRAPRRDALANRDRLLAAAAIQIRAQGAAVPMSEIATAAGVGVGTLYRHFPSREDLLAALTHRSFEMVLARAQAAAAHDGPAVDAIARFFDDTISHHAELVLPLHGGPADLSDEARGLRSAIRAALAEVLERGREDGSLRADLTPADIVIAGAQLAQPLPQLDDWPAVARRQAQLLVEGLA